MKEKIFDPGKPSAAQNIAAFNKETL